MTPCGIFVGVRYTDPNTSQLTFSQTYPASTAADDIMAYVVDDPNVVFQAQGDASLAQTALGNNVLPFKRLALRQLERVRTLLTSSTIAVTKTLPIRIIDFVDGPNSEVGDAFTDVICKFNSGGDATGDSCASSISRYHWYLGEGV